MANSNVIEKAKNKIVREFIKDNDIITAINSDKYTPKEPEKYINSHIFDYHQNPYTLESVQTFITVQVHITDRADYNGTYVLSSVEIWIISHERHMRVSEIPKVTSNRNDYLSRLIDKLLNGKDGFGLGKLKLITNVEGSFQQDYLYRKMIFEGKDINNSFCEDE